MTHLGVLLAGGPARFGSSCARSTLELGLLLTLSLAFGCSSSDDGPKADAGSHHGGGDGDGHGGGDGDRDFDSGIPELPPGFPSQCADFVDCCLATYPASLCNDLISSFIALQGVISDEDLADTCGQGCTYPDACADNDVLTLATLRTAKENLAKGATSVKLSPSGCTTFSRTVVNGAVVKESLSHGRSGSSEQGLFEATYGPNEATVKTSLGGNPTWKALATSDARGELSKLTLETSDPLEGTLLRREVYVPKDADNFHVTIDAPSTAGDEIAPLGPFDAPAAQAVSFGPSLTPAGVSTEGCSSEQTTALEMNLEQIVIDGFKCLDSKGRPDMANFILGQYLSRKITFECKALGTGTDQIAQLAILGRMTSWLFGSFSITINTDHFFANDSSADPAYGEALRRNVLFHELMHLYNGAHQPSIGGPRMTEWDRTYACAGTCFPLLNKDTLEPTTTKCACAVCLGKTVCDNECSGFKECDPNLGANCNAFPPKWHATEMECADACSENCETRDVDCDPCN